MPKKTKSKARLDKFYRFAKQQGYRSRAAFKLIQLNKKYNFLADSSVLVDLCAAPGGWLQVAQKFMPMGSLKIGLDLDPIKKIPNVKTFQQDITTQKCIDLLKKQLHGQKADVFLNDGAPNVGANWSKDAHNQSQLVLSALRLASMFLKEGGYFVTKVFRSTDYNSLIWVFNKFFKRVQATKPEASRFTSAQIFVVCIGYLAPTFIDQKLFDAKIIFQDTQADHLALQMNKQITSMDKLLEVRRSRGGYADDAPMHLYKQTNLSKFIEADNPFPIFMQFNRIVVAPQQQKYFQMVKKPDDFDNMIADLKVLGRRDVSALLKWRGKIRMLNYVKNKVVKQKVAKQVNSQDELQKQIIQEQRKQFKILKKQKQRQEELLLMSKGAIDGGHNSQEQIINDELNKILQQNDLQQLDYAELSEQDLPQNQNKISYKNTKQLAENIQEMYQARKQRLLQKTKQIKKVREGKKNKDKKNIQVDYDQNKLKATQIDSHQVKKQLKKSKIINKQILQIDPTLVFDNPLANQQDIYISDEQEINMDGVNVDPNQKMPNQLSDDEAYVIPKQKSQMQKRRQKLNRKKNKEQKASKQKKQAQIQIVPKKSMEDYNIDSLAQTLAIAQKMLRNRNRQQIINSSYGRYTFEDHENLPNWFTDDEKKHNYKSAPITKEQYIRQKNRLLAINARAPKKVVEAKIRKKMKLQRKLKKTRVHAEKIMEQEGVGEYHKMKQVNKIYQKELTSAKQQKKYVVSKSFKGRGGKQSRGVKYVDSRLKKDKRADKNNSKKIKKTRHVHRKNNKKARF